MHISVTRDFSKWAQEDKYLERLEICRLPVKSTHTKKQVRKLRSLGMTSKSLALLHSSMQDSCETGFAAFSKIRFLCWYWDNGDKIIFPLNSRNSLYIGNDSEDWCVFWPFFRLIKLNVYECSLPEVTNDFARSSSQEYSLGVGGQSHFGHFVANRVASLHQSALAHPYISTLRKILVPKEYLELHEYVMATILGGSGKDFQQLPDTSGIYTFDKVVVPSISEHPNAITGLKGILEDKNQARQIKKGKRTYITRSDDECNDRLCDYKSFRNILAELGFQIINPMQLSAIQRLTEIGDSEFILTDPGSCALNGLLFGNMSASIKCMIPKRVLQSTDSFIMNQLCLGFSQGVQGYWLPIQSQTISQTNPWYDICVPPSIITLKELFGPD